MTRLEETLRIRLLIHVGWGIRIPPEGLKLLKDAARIFQIIESSFLKILAIAGTMEKIIDLGVSSLLRMLNDLEFKDKRISRTPVMEGNFLETIKTTVRSSIGTSSIHRNRFSKLVLDQNFLIINSLKEDSVLRLSNVY